jgi:hypothetical protein
MLDEGVTRLSRPYQVEVSPGVSGLLVTSREMVYEMTTS